MRPFSDITLGLVRHQAVHRAGNAPPPCEPRQSRLVVCALAAVLFAPGWSISPILSTGSTGVAAAAPLASLEDRCARTCAALDQAVSAAGVADAPRPDR